ncbi:unnamed protein product [Arctogadus glacialis]
MHVCLKKHDESKAKGCPKTTTHLKVIKGIIFGWLLAPKVIKGRRQTLTCCSKFVHSSTTNPLRNLITNVCIHVLLHTDMDYPPHSLGALLPHHHPIVDHSRSRYRGQPPSQPYYLFQWNLNPYHRYGQALSAHPCVRPHVARRPDMYPGYGTSQAMGYPADYKRGFNSHSSSPVAPGFHRGYARKTGTSEDQRDPRDPLCKLVERLDGLSTKEEKENGDDGEEEEYLPTAPPPGRRGPPWVPGVGELQGTGEPL